MNSEYNLRGWPIIYERYQTLELLGAGGFGEVYKCFDLEKKRYVAVKKIRFDKKVDGDRKDEFYRHVRREIEIQQTLSHPNIAKLEEVLDLNKDKNCVIF